MRILQILASAIALFTALNAEQIEQAPTYSIGPYDMRFQTGDLGAYFANRKTLLDNPICYAINHTQTIEVILQVYTRTAENEVKVTKKELLIEPYLFGTEGGTKPVLLGNILEEKTLRFTLTNYGQEGIDNSYSHLPVTYGGQEQDTIKVQKGFFARLFNSDTTLIQKIDLSHATEVKVIQGSLFTPREEFRDHEEKSIKPLCEIKY